MKKFNVIRKQLENQYQDIKFDSESGLSKEELVAKLEQHQSEYPNEARIITRAWLFQLLCGKARIAG